MHFPALTLGDGLGDVGCVHVSAVGRWARFHAYSD